MRLVEDLDFRLVALVHGERRLQHRPNVARDLLGAFASEVGGVVEERRVRREERAERLLSHLVCTKRQYRLFRFRISSIATRRAIGPTVELPLADAYACLLLLGVGG